jgi:tetratricopeptide (TPR) repeat protein
VIAEAPQRIGRYLVRDRLGAGGMGVVYRAFDPELNRQVAVKLMRAGGWDTAGGARLMREAQAIAQVAHPNVVAVFDVGTADGELFVAMELVEGDPLDRWLQTPRPPAEILPVFLQAGRGLLAAHAAGLVHRDFKPANVLLGRDGRVRVVDFGIVRRLADPEPTADGTPSPGTLTAAGARIGTLAYMSPEQHRGEPADERSDQFSFCVALYEALYRERPFPVVADGALDTLDALALATVKGDVAPAPAGARVPPWLRRAVVRGLAVDPAQRHPSMAALLAELGRDPARTRRRVLVGLGAVALVAALAWPALRPAASSVCAGGAARVAAVWSPERGQAVRAAFAATGSGVAGESAERVVALLDRYTAAWTDAHREACLATRVRREQSEELLDKRMTCLEQRLGEVGELVGLAEHADARLVARAPSAAEALADLGACADVRNLGATRPLPGDPVLRGRVAALFGRVGAAGALQAAQRFADARVLLLLALPEIQLVGYRPLEAQALRLLADIARMTDDLPLAEQALGEAVLAAEAGGDDRTKAMAQSDLAFVAGAVLSHRAEGEAWARRARATIERLGGDDLLEAHRLTDVVEYEEDDTATLGRAVDDAGRAVELLERRLPADDKRVRDARFIRAGVLHKVGRDDEALALARATLASEVQALGPNAPDLVTTYRLIGSCLRRLGRYQEALAGDERAVEIARQAAGPDSLFHGIALTGLGYGYMMAGRPAEAEQRFRAAIRIKSAVYGADSPFVASTLIGLANTLDYQGRYEECLGVLEQSRAIFERAGDLDNTDYGAVENNIGDALRGLHRPADAIPHYQRAIDQLGRLGPDVPLVASPLIGLARARIDAGDPAGALPLLERARALRAKTPADFAVADLDYASALALEATDPEQARVLAASAFARYRDAGPVAARDAAAVAAWLARADRAVKPSRRAR